MCKRGIWSLLATSPDGLRTYRLSRVRSVLVTDDPAERPPDFDLAEAWDSVKRRLAERVPEPVTVGLLVEADVLRRLRGGVGAWWPIEENGFDGAGRAQVEIRFPSARVAAVELAPFGDRVEVTGPEAVRAELADLGRRLVGRYAAPG